MKNQLSNQMNKTSNNIFHGSMMKLLTNGDVLNEASKFDNSQLEKLRSKKTKWDGLNMANFAQGLREHVRLAPKLTETVKGKLSLGAKMIQLGGVEKAFKKIFGIGNGEKLLKASQCYLSTTAGPIAGLLFISNFKISFFSERSIKIVSQSGNIDRVHYKVSIPSANIRQANAREDVKRSMQKYIEIVTNDNFKFWFMGFLNLQRTLEYLQLAL